MTETTKPNRKLLPAQCVSAEYCRRDMIASPEAGTSIDDMLVPAYWAHVARELRALDRIEVRPADGTWWAELLVRVVEPVAVRVYVLRYERFAPVAAVTAEAPPGYTVRFRGAERFVVIRDADGEVVHSKEPTKEHALAWLSGHLRRLGSDEGKRAA